MSARRQGSVSDLTYMISRSQSQPVRTGAIASFPSLEALTRGFDNVASMLPAFDAREHSQRYANNNQPPNVLNYALRIFDEKDDMGDEAWAQKVVELVNSKKIAPADPHRFLGVVLDHRLRFTPHVNYALPKRTR